MTPAVRPHDPFLDLTALLHQNTKGRRWMVSLQLYLDESGHVSRHPFVVVAGFMGTDDAWSGFTDAWNAILATHGVTPPFHMTDFEGKRDQFATDEWKDDKKRRSLVGALMKQITDRPLFMIGSAISVEGFKKFDWSKYPNYKPLESPYLLAVQDVLRCAVDATYDPETPECHGDKIATVLARQDELQGAADGYYRAMAFNDPKLVKQATFGDQAEFPQLQAADIAAFEFRWKLTRPDLNRYPWAQLVNAGRITAKGQGISKSLMQSLFFPTERGRDYRLTMSIRPRSTDMTLKMKDSKASRNQGKRSKGRKR